MTNDTTATSTTAAATETEASASAETTVSTPALTAEQEINALRAAHQFFSNFDRVPGFLANQWSQALDTIAVVANSLIGKNGPATPADTSAEAADTTVTQ
jgi:hypothetical protein